ncbi:hypothetical protein IT417_00860 [bacterium]|nr:hypothetical protein [bacterium]
MTTKDRVAQLFSKLFNAYLTYFLTYALIILADKDNIASPGGIMLLLLVLNIANLLIFKKFGLISDWEISDRKQRPRFTLAASIVNLVMIVVASGTNSSLLLSVALAIFAINFTQGVISILWKVSGHMLYLACLVFTSIALYPSAYLIVFWGVILVIVAWSRVQLKRHTVAQVIVGALLGLLIPLLLL